MSLARCAVNDTVTSSATFNEPITKAKLGALAMILLGIVCIGVGGRN